MKEEPLLFPWLMDNVQLPAGSTPAPRDFMEVSGMPDREKVISGLQRCRLMNKLNCDKCPYDYNGRGNGKSECTAELADDVLTLLKEQDNCENCAIAIEDRQPVVRCKDCKHRPREIPFTTSWGETQTYLEFPNDSKCPCWNPSEEYYSWNPDDDWFCADGERKEGR